MPCIHCNFKENIEKILSTPEEIEKLSEEVHLSWMETKEKQGFHSPKDCKDKAATLSGENCGHCHPDMIPYSELSEPKKDINRNTALTVLHALLKIL